MKLIQVNLIRRKSLLRVERPQPITSSEEENVSFAGQKQTLSD
jgi:hypothetical protein